VRIGRTLSACSSCLRKALDIPLAELVEEKKKGRSA
jgi:hypothetical protein